jgi:uncharacterized membrane protein
VSVDTGVRSRLVELDRLRGLAILLMIADHLALVAGTPIVRVTAGRLAVPLFFVVAGHLAGSRLSWRHLEIGALGLVLPLVVTFVDSPNVLLWWALGCVVLYVWQRLRWPVWGLIVAALTLGANGWVLTPGAHSYNPLDLLGLMALGRGMGPELFVWGRRLPGWFGGLGRCPLRWYVGHVALVQLALVVLGRV